MKDIYVVGLTGPTGAGKTTVAKMFEKKGIKVIDADIISREVTNHSSRGLQALTVAFGEDILDDTGALDRRKLAEIAFSSKENTKKLNDTLHPLIIMEIRRRIRRLALEGNNLVIIDAALLFESDCHYLCNDIISVVADDNIRIKRIMERDNISEESALKRMKAQKELTFYINNSNHIISNGEDIYALEDRVNELAKTIREDANEVHR